MLYHRGLRGTRRRFDHRDQPEVFVAAERTAFLDLDHVTDMRGVFGVMHFEFFGEREVLSVLRIGYPAIDTHNGCVFHRRGHDDALKAAAGRG